MTDLSARRRTATRRLPVLLALGVVGAAGVLAAPGATAATSPAMRPSCQVHLASDPATVAYTCTVTYAYTGAEQTFSIPSDMTGLTVTLIGGAGGQSADRGAGAAAAVTSSLTLPTGQRTLYVEVGGNGVNEGGFNGGGASDPGFLGHGGTGGGATDVRTSPRSAADSPASRLAIAAGGGGSGVVPGSNGGDAGQRGAGPGGGQGAGGTAVDPRTCTPPACGALGLGGTGARGGGGGGGGWFGGNGGDSAGGGGGSSLGTVTGLSTQPASVVLTYTSLSTRLGTLPVPATARALR